MVSRFHCLTGLLLSRHQKIFLSALLPLKGKQTEKFGRRGRPWPREREGPATESWEGFTGPNFYGLVIQRVFLRIIISEKYSRTCQTRRSGILRVQSGVHEDFRSKLNTGTPFGVGLCYRVTATARRMSREDAPIRILKTPGSTMNSWRSMS